MITQFSMILSTFNMQELSEKDTITNPAILFKTPISASQRMMIPRRRRPKSLVL
jgi:hypothetical protein